jgi:hypothetical protein
MKRNIWLFLLSPLLVLTVVPANADSINFTDLLPSTGTGICDIPPDPTTSGAQFGSPAGCWTLQSQLFGTPGDGFLPGSGIAGSSNLTVTGTDGTGDSNGNDMFTFTQFTTVITDATSGDLTFNWNYSTFDVGSFYDPAGYIYCPASNSNPTCQTKQLTMDFDGLGDPSLPFGDPGSLLPGSLLLGGISDPSTNSAFNPDGSVNILNLPSPPVCDLNALICPPGFAESGTVTVFGLSAGDTFGAWVASNSNTFGAGQIILSNILSNTEAPTPEPASFLLIGGGLLALGWAGRKARRRGAGQ